MPEGKPLNIIEQEIQMNLCTSSDTHWKKKKKPGLSICLEENQLLASQMRNKNGLD